MNSESANRFIAALVKSLQTLCHGYVDFDDGIEIIGHLYLNIDSGSTFDYVLKEKVCKNAENSTVFLSKSFHAEGKPENTLIRNEKGEEISHEDGQSVVIGGNGMSPTGTTRLQSAITNISNVLSGTEHHSAHPSLPSNAGRRKRDHNGSYSNTQLPYKYTTLQSSSSSAMPYFSNSIKQQHSSSRDNSKHYNTAQGEFFGGDSNPSSGMGADEEEDLHLDVTFVKEEYGDRHRQGHARAHQQDPSPNQSNIMSGSNASGATSFPMDYHTGSQGHQFPGNSGSGGGGDINNLNPSFQDPSQVDTGQHLVPPPPNPRSVSSGNALPQSTSNSDNNQQTFQVPAVPTKYFRCNVCGIIIRHKNNIKRHMRRHNGDVFHCSYCQSTHTCKWQLQKHLQYKHGVFTDFPYETEDGVEEKVMQVLPDSEVEEKCSIEQKVMQILPDSEEEDRI